MVMLSDKYPEHGIGQPDTFGGTGSLVCLHVEDIDTMTKPAMVTGATVIIESKDQFIQ